MRRLALIVWVATLACSAPNPDYDRGSKPDAAEAGAPDVPGGPPPPDVAPEVAPEASPDLAADLGPLDAPSPSALGQACTTGATCASGTCVHGVCCNTDCRQRCWSCTLAPSLGTCAPVPSEQDPHDDCPAEAPSTCGRSGACDGAGACTLHAAGTQCRPQTCAAGVETAANLCDGAGKCNAGAVRACPMIECMADTCAVGCQSSAVCGTGRQCVSGRCTGDGPALHWRFDEASGSVAEDASGNGIRGTYTGEPTLPTPSTNVPPISPNSRSRTFAPSGRPGVTLVPADSRLLSTSEMTISSWFRATSAPAQGGSVFSIDLDVMLRVGPDTIEFDKRKSLVDGQMYAIAMARDVTGHLDGRWHHLAAVFSSKGMDIYLDGQLRDHDVDGQPTLFRAGVLWVGREAATGHDFRGDLDDVRLYTRALTQAEITALYGGGL
jgi:hypothetical protein